MEKSEPALIVSFFIGIFILLSVSCKKKEECQFPTNRSSFNFGLADQYGINQIATWGSRYDSDSVYFTKSDGTPANSLEIRGNGRILFNIQDDDNEANDTLITRQFFLYLPDLQGHPKDDIDTVQFKYRSSARCFENLQVFYNDSLYHNGEYISLISFIKN